MYISPGMLELLLPWKEYAELIVSPDKPHGGYMVFAPPLFNYEIQREKLNTFILKM